MGATDDYIAEIRLAEFEEWERIEKEAEEEERMLEVNKGIIKW